MAAHLLSQARKGRLSRDAGVDAADLPGREVGHPRCVRRSGGGEMTLGSLFSGSGGFELAGVLNGIVPLWASEIEPYPIAVTTSRFPHLEHLGNVANINGSEIPPVDVVTFGSPCQDVSVAGKQVGLHEGKRSSLFFEALRIIREMRCATHGKYPRFAVFENVPGLFSTAQGADFRAVLQAFVSLCDDSFLVPEPPKGRWLHAGEIQGGASALGDHYSIAWRVLGAEHWGVPQRRNRIYLVADFAGGCAGKVLFEQAGLRRHSEAGPTSWQGTSDDAERGLGGSAGFLKGQGVKAHGIGYEEERSPTLRSQAGGNSVPCVICQNPWDSQSKRVFDTDGIFPTLPAGSSGGQNDQSVIYPAVCNESGPGYWMPGFGCLRAEGENRPSRPGHLICFAQNQRDEVRDLGDRSGALAANAGMKQQSYLTYALQGNGIDRADTAGCNGCGWKPDVSYTLNTIDRHAVCYQETVGALCAADWRGPNSQYVQSDKLVVDPLCTDARGNGDGQICATITGDHENRVTDYTNVITYGGDKAGTLDASYYKGAGARNGKEREFIAEAKPGRKYIVRRLSTTECARLQGFPDCWAIPMHKDSLTDEEIAFWEEVRGTFAMANGKGHRPFSSREQLLRWYNRLHTDSAEYKLYGNGICVNCVLMVMQGIVWAENTNLY